MGKCLEHYITDAIESTMENKYNKEQRKNTTKNQILSKGLKYNLHYKQGNWIKTLAIEANPTEQTYVSQAVANKVQTLINYEKTRIERKVTHKVKQEIHEKKLINSIKKKMEQVNLIVTKTDKGNTVIIMHQD
jgi:ABC-type lipoprotein release transport system permease subunit